jgi:lysophospholipase L1-like esterase
MTGTISIKGVSDDVAISFIAAMQGISGKGISFTPDAVQALPLNSRICFEGDSITAGSNGPTFVEFALIRSQGRFYAPVGYNQAKGGETALQMATLAETSAVTATNPKVVVYMSGINDLKGSTDTPATIHANQRTAIEAYQAAGAHVVQIATLKSIDPQFTSLGSGREADRLALRNLILGQADVTVVDLEAIWDPTTMTTTNTDEDQGLHPNYLGAITIGNAVGDVLNRLITADTPIAHSFDGANLMLAADNPQLSGVGGTKQVDSPATGTLTGDVATGWVFETNSTGIDAVISKTTLNGNPAQRIQVSGSNDVKRHNVTFRNTVTYNGQQGQAFETWWDFQLAAGSQGIETIGCSCDTTQMPIQPFPDATTLIALQSMPSSQALSGVLRPPNVAVLAAADTSTTVQVVLEFQAGAVAADLTIGAPYFAQVPAGQ